MDQVAVVSILERSRHVATHIGSRGRHCICSNEDQIDTMSDLLYYFSLHLLHKRYVLGIASYENNERWRRLLGSLALSMIVVAQVDSVVGVVED
jgi:hypothetical protein